MYSIISATLVCDPIHDIAKYDMPKENLNVEEKVIVSKIFGMAGDGAFCKDNAMPLSRKKCKDSLKKVLNLDGICFI